MAITAGLAEKSSFPPTTFFLAITTNSTALAASLLAFPHNPYVQMDPIFFCSSPRFSYQLLDKAVAVLQVSLLFFTKDVLPRLHQYETVDN